MPLIAVVFFDPWHAGSIARLRNTGDVIAGEEKIPRSAGRDKPAAMPPWRFPCLKSGARGVRVWRKSGVAGDAAPLHLLGPAIEPRRL